MRLYYTLADYPHGAIEIGTNPTATTSTGRMVAGQTEYHGVPIGAGYMVAAITNT